MAFFLNQPKKNYATTGPTAWLKRYVEFRTDAVKQEVEERVTKIPICDGTGEGGAVVNDVRPIETDESGIRKTGNIAEGAYSLAGGTCTEALGAASVALGTHTAATQDNQLVSGCYNAEDADALQIVGNGTSEESRKNAYTLDKGGNGWFAGDVTVGEKKERLITEQEVKTALKTKADITRKTATPEWKESDGSYRAEARLDECTEAGLYEVDCAVGIIKTNYPLYPSQGEPSIIGSWTVNDARAYVFVSVNEPNDEKNMRAGYPKQIQQVCIGMKNDRLKMRTGNIESEDAGVVWEEWVSLDNLFASVAEANTRLEALEATDSVLAEAEQLQESYLGGDEG